MAWLTVVEVVKVVVEMVEKMGCFGGKKEEEKCGVVGVVVVGMEERKVVEMVVEEVVRVAGQGGTAQFWGYFWVCCGWLEVKEERKKNERERRKRGVYK